MDSSTTSGPVTNAGYAYRHIVEPSSSGETTLSYLVRKFSHSNEDVWRQRIIDGEVLLNDRVAAGEELLRAGSVLVWRRPGWAEADVPCDYSVVFRDEHLIVVNKPSGLPTLPGAGFLRNTLLSLVQCCDPEARPVHRLGRATSGLVLMARSSLVAARLSQSWLDVRKQYQALAVGGALEETYDIHVPIGPVSHPRLGTVHAASETGKPAHSAARVLERRESSTVFEVDLWTGRPHQIRIHLASIGHPLVGDPLYAVGGVPRSDEPGLPGDAGYWLHAKRLVFDHPITGESLELTAPLPECLRCE